MKTKKKTKTPKKEIKINAGKRGRKKKEVLEEAATTDVTTTEEKPVHKFGALIPYQSTGTALVPVSNVRTLGDAGPAALHTQRMINRIDADIYKAIKKHSKKSGK